MQFFIIVVKLWKYLSYHPSLLQTSGGIVHIFFSPGRVIWEENHLLGLHGCKPFFGIWGGGRYVYNVKRLSH